jgi:hypothetical protein
MTRQNTRLLLCAAAISAVAFLGACHHDHAPVAPPPPPPPSSTVNFSTFATDTFKASAFSTPVNFDALALQYDVNDDPTAFDALLM